LGRLFGLPLQFFEKAVFQFLFFSNLTYISRNAGQV